MRFGVSMPNAGDPADLVDLAALAEEAGWDGFVGTLQPAISAADLAKAGATWAMDGPASPTEPFAEIAGRIAAGPAQ